VSRQKSRFTKLSTLRVSQALGQVIEEYIRAEKWAEARKLILPSLKEQPGNHWLMTRLGLTYYEERNYTKALAITENALRLAPHCPLVLWDYAGCLDMGGRKREAIQIWKRLMRRGVDSLAYGQCGEGLRWARGLLNDCRYRVGVAYATLGNRRTALLYLRQYQENRGLSQFSIYTTRQAKAKIAQIEKGPNLPGATAGLPSHVAQ
jgi:predicted Zn-dependent protease